MQKIFTSLFEYSELPKKIIYYTYVVIAYATLISLCNRAMGQTNPSQITKPVINDYRKVTSINADDKTVTFSGTSMFKQAELPDTVLLIQMTGITMNGVVPTTGAGLYEFHIVESVVESGSNFIATLKSAPGIYANFTPGSESVQIIRVPSYKNAEIPQTNTLQCQMWNWATGTGGVLALMVDETLTINGNIDVSGLGFNGGKTFGKAYSTPCSFNEADNTNKPDYPGNSDLAGYKGEGAVTKSYLDTYPKGYGKTWNGGGGGNGKWSGGGGGANGANGGNGDEQACNVPGSNNGNRGSIISYGDFNSSERTFMGGGGGAGTGNGTAGGNGGGVVIIVAQKLEFADNIAIKSNGGSVAGSLTNAGAGGGGAGGSILLSATGYDNIRIEIAGGNGGGVDRGSSCDNTNNSIGAGGGGSGGLLLTTNDMSWYQQSIINRIKRNGGAAGTIAGGISGCSGYSTPGSAGIYLGNFQVQLRGFLRNNIVPSSIESCPGKEVTIEASQPQGGVGVGTYIYLWQISSTGTGNWANIANSNVQNLEHAFAGNTWVRRRVTWGGTVDDSTPIPVIVGTAINNSIAPTDTTLCWQSSYVIRGNTPTEGGGGGPYTFQWQELIGDNWTDIKGAINKNLPVSLQASGGIQTYRRQATGKSCTSDGNISKITVQPLITGNTITPGDQKVCGDHAQKLTGPVPAGGAGAGSYRYYWQVKTEGMDWTDLNNPVTVADYQPILNTPQITSANRYKERNYQRYVVSDKCNSTSNAVVVRFDQQSSESVITTGDQVGGNALKYKFSEELIATVPAVGSGIWSSTDEKLSFSPPGEPTTTVSNLQLGMNTVIWTVSNGTCVSEPASIAIEVIDVTIPNGFSPNGDGFNDCFRVVGGENATSCEITVLDRYNNVVFESKSFKGSSNLNDCSGWWDGRTSSGKELPTGTYFYQLTLNGDKVYKGYVVLKKQ